MALDSLKWGGKWWQTHRRVSGAVLSFHEDNPYAFGLGASLLLLFLLQHRGKERGVEGWKEKYFGWFSVTRCNRRVRISKAGSSSSLFLNIQISSTSRSYVRKRTGPSALNPKYSLGWGPSARSQRQMSIDDAKATCGALLRLVPSKLITPRIPKMWWCSVQVKRWFVPPSGNHNKVGELEE